MAGFFKGVIAAATAGSLGVITSPTSTTGAASEAIAKGFAIKSAIGTFAGAVVAIVASTFMLLFRPKRAAAEKDPKTKTMRNVLTAVAAMLIILAVVISATVGVDTYLTFTNSSYARANAAGDVVRTIF